MKMFKNLHWQDREKLWNGRNFWESQCFGIGDNKETYIENILLIDEDRNEEEIISYEEI